MLNDLPTVHLFLLFVLFIAILLYLSLYFTTLTTLMWFAIIVAFAYLILYKYFEKELQHNQTKIDQRTRYLDQMMETLWFYA